MAIDIVSIAKNGRFVINLNSQYAKTLYKLAKYGIDTQGFLTDEYGDTLNMAGDKLNLIASDLKKAQTDFDNIFYHNNDGITYETHPMMVWNIAWSVYLLSDCRIANAYHFFECNRTLLLTFKNSHTLVDYTQQLNNTELAEKQRKVQQVPACVSSQIRRMDNAITACRKDADTLSTKIGKTEDDLINRVKKEQALMENNYRATLQQVAEQSREALVALGKELEEKKRQLERANAALEAANSKIEWLQSEEYRNKAGLDFLVQVVLNEIAACEHTDDSVARRKQYESLAPIILKIEGFPKEITDRVLALAVTPQSHEHMIYVSELNGSLNVPENQTINHLVTPFVI